jgi:quercetin dioxygenase-like cupin family protein
VGRSGHLVDAGNGSTRLLLRAARLAEPGAVRRMHNHADATYHVFTLLTGQLTLTVEGQEPVEVKAGEVLELKGGVMHTFKNTGTVTATIVEVFGQAPK